MPNYLNLTPGEAAVRQDTYAAAGRDHERECEECDKTCPLKLENGDPCDHEDMAPVLKQLMDAYTRRHHNSKELRRQLEDGGLVKRMKWLKRIGKLKAFDPDGHMALLVKAKEVLGI